jgi:hypothetical protein
MPSPRIRVSSLESRALKLTGLMVRSRRYPGNAALKRTSGDEKRWTFIEPLK